MMSLTPFLLALVTTCTEAFSDFNFNPVSPPHVHAHIFMFGNGSVSIAEGDNPFANNALSGDEFMSSHLGWSNELVDIQKQEARNFWIERFGLDGEELEERGDGIVIKYQISPEVNERAYVLNTPCPTPPEGHEVLDGGFQLFVTHPDGVKVPDPMTGEEKHYPFQTNLVYAWLKIHVREEGEDCGVMHPPPEWIVLRYQTLEPAKWTLNAIVFELEIIGENYFGSGRSLGISAPIINDTTITNRLLNYITFHNHSLDNGNDTYTSINHEVELYEPRTETEETNTKDYVLTNKTTDKQTKLTADKV